MASQIRHTQNQTIKRIVPPALIPMATMTRQHSSKSVRFYPFAQVRSVVSIKSMKSRLWYTETEFVGMLQRDNDMLDWMDQDSEDENQDSYSFRGLEGRTSQGAVEKRWLRAQAYNAVLDEQDDQWDTQDLDVESIREAYLPHSRESQYRAHQLALGDAMWVEQDRQTCRKVKTRNSMPASFGASRKRQQIAHRRRTFLSHAA